MFLKRQLSYLAEDFGITDYDDFSDYLFENFRKYVWRVYDGIEYCHPGDAEFLAKSYLEYKSTVAQYW